jgi:hypothetical protein
MTYFLFQKKWTTYFCRIVKSISSRLLDEALIAIFFIRTALIGSAAPLTPRFSPGFGH